MFLLYTNEAEWAGVEEATVIREHAQLIEDLVETGKYKTSDALESFKTATTVRVRGGKTLFTDGPFAETKEYLGGYYIVDAKGLDEAIAIAARIPDARVGSVEIRPIRAIDM
jgi:hypothetical protein